MPTPDLLTAELTLTGRITTASNATFLGTIGELVVVYKPRAGESPLWDFPRGTLAHREAAAYKVSEVLGWNIVPHTWLRDGPLGEGMVQAWQEEDPDQNPVDLIPANEVPGSSWKQVLRGQGEDGQMVALVHEDSAALRRMAAFDAVVNNADRKGNHILAMTGGHRHGVDHGLTFHRDNKLRTVLWGWVGDPLTNEELDGVRRVSAALDGQLGRDLEELITPAETGALADRCAALLEEGHFPPPGGESSAVPWPLF
ncbi:SCO1664 family protein [Paenarthrobacter ilicis]|uniref:Repeat protein (TIGR03843 family) n=1 Tax=Paenarthrobacter ilicis TaxID=43665 RepID=A0ABX0TC17_9MICC|nr:SCO1664 family protein [Paenarthrobacter ilicis]MBM7793879.1 putative repeat protein (TIGR03843 family) [Paenarthrobacter ilicis]NIJ00059.1 putative repeat protein (TIGR03843 family) [Paenarthrobacter ilicis]